MYNAISISLGELVLKGKNRGQFEQKLDLQIKRVLKEKELKLYRDRGKIFIDTIEDTEGIIKEISNIFGIVMISPCIKTTLEREEIRNAVIETISYKRKEKQINTFKIMTSRANKKYPVDSMEMNRWLGGEVLNHFPDIRVDVHQPDMIVYVDIRSFCYVASQKIKGVGGLPMGTNGKGLVLLSGGIDSPVAAYMMARRGVRVSFLTFHAYPFTSERAKDKVRQLVDLLTTYCIESNLYSINLLNIYQEIKKKCPEDESTIIARRFMMKIAEEIALEKQYDFLITGESLGQVASQTSKALGVIDAAVSIPILRPVIGMDKTEIIEISRRIGTYETSILPYEDCCSVFSPLHPVTQPKKDKILESETVLNDMMLIEEALQTLEKETFKL